MGVKIELSLEQIADALRHLKKDEVETLELLVSADTEKELLKRRKEARVGNTLPIEKMRAFKGI